MVQIVPRREVYWSPLSLRESSPASYQTHGSDNATRSANIQLPTVHTKPKAAVPRDAERARLTGVISRILKVGGGAWAEIAVDGAPDLFREIRVPYPIKNEDGSVSRFEVGDRVAIFVSAL